MDFLNIWAIITAAISAMVVGFVWYHPKVFGTVWMQTAGVTEEELKTGNMAKIFGLALVFAIMLAFIMESLVIHQAAALSLIGGDSSVALPSYYDFMADYGNHYRTFKHGVLHGVVAGLFFALPVLGTNALFERKSFKYIFINSGYWIVTLGLMGGIIGAWV